MPLNPSKFEIGQTVRKTIQREQIGIIEGYDYIQGRYWYNLKLHTGQSIVVEEESIEVYAQTKNVENLFQELNFSNKASFSRVTTYSKLSGGYSSNPTSLKSSKTLFEPYQFKPLLKFLFSDDQRLLIADEVGLGKTIEAGHILLEMHSREPIKSLLVVCPKSLVIKWQRELSEKFFFDLEIIKKQRFLKFLNDYNAGITQKIYGIISYQSVRSKDVIKRISEVNPEIDFVIFDEMHWARNEDSLTHKVTRLISEQAVSALGLTATPVMIGSKNLFNILKILSPFEFTTEHDFNNRLEENKPIIKAIRHIGEKNFESAFTELSNVDAELYVNSPIYQNVLNELKKPVDTKEKVLKLLRNTTELSLFSHILTRTRRREVNLKSERRPMTVNIKFTKNERRFYDAVTRFVREKYALLNENRRGSSFALMMPQRQVASCIPAMIRLYAKDGMKTQKLLDSLSNEYEENADLNGEDSFNEGAEDLIIEFNEFINKVKSDERFIDSKYSKLKEALDELYKNNPDTKVLIFSYFKATVAYLSEKLSADGYKNYEISGEKKSEERNIIHDDFRYKNDIKILISTEVSSEGLDLEFCNVIVNYDLPWNPMVVEQRIGRLDRIGQNADVITIINFSVEGTIESRILERLFNRIEIFKESIGDLESILGDEISKLTDDLLSQQLTPAEEERRIEQAANVIFNKKLEAAELEKQSASILTYDEYFKHELEAILKERRYLTTQELYVYLNEFLIENFIDCRIKETNDNTIWEMYVSPELEQKIQASLQRNSNINEQFFEFSRQIKVAESRVILFTFEPEIAFKNKTLVYINNSHPIVKFVTEHYMNNSEAIFRCSSLSIKNSTMLPNGNYFYFTYEFEIEGGRKIKNLSHVILDLSGKNVLTESEAAEFIGDLLVRGETYILQNNYYEKNANTAILKANNIALRRFSNLTEDIEHLNKSTISKQLEIVNRSYGYKIDRLKQTIDEVQYDEKRARIIPVLKANIKKLEDEKSKKEYSIKARKHLEKQMKLIAAGFVIVKN